MFKQPTRTRTIATPGSDRTSTFELFPKDYYQPPVRQPTAAVRLFKRLLEALTGRR